MLLQPLNPRNLATVLFEEAIIVAFLGFIPGFVVPLGLYRLARNATNLPIYMTLFRAVFVLLPGLTQNYEKTNHEGHKGHEVKRVSESSCVSPNC